MIDRRRLVAGAVTAGAALGGMPIASPALADQPGSRSAAEPSASPRQALGGERIAMLLWPGFTALDFMGPYHFLAMPGAQVHVVTTGDDLRPVPSDRGVAVQPTTTLKDCPDDLTVLFVPGGSPIPAARDPRLIAFVRDRAERAQFVTSVCTGALVLGVAGVLKGRRATSHWSVTPLLDRFGAIPTRERVVEDGKVITGAGVSAGLDFGSALVAKLRGTPMAEIAVLVAEYDPQPPIKGGSIETARPEISRIVQAGFERLVRETMTLEVLG
jgi:cyclohexyl-isocyanide hydratase